MTTGPIDNGVNPWAVADPAGHRQYMTQIMDTLRDDYHLHAEEAEYAFGLYLRRQTGWLTPEHAAFQAHNWWRSTIHPSTVAAGNAEERTKTQQEADPVPNRANLDSAASPAGDEQADRVDPQFIQAQLDATASAIAMIRGQGQTDRFTVQHQKLAQQLRQVLDASPIRDSITPAESAPTDHPQPVDLDPALRPDTVRARVASDDLVAIDAAFAGTTITVVRTPGPLGPSRYTFMFDTHDGRGEQEANDAVKIGMIAAGHRTPDPARDMEYLCLGLQVRSHLMGLVDALADSREGWHEQQARRLRIANGAPDAGNDAERHQSPAALRPAR